MTSATAASAGGASRPLALPGNSGPLKYANAQDVPGYSSPGLNPGGAAASAAAALGWANTAASAGSPGEVSPATPRSSDALLAAGWAQRRPSRSPVSPPSPPSSPWVSAAATLAFQAGNTQPPTYEFVDLSRRNSMHAARGAMVARPRSKSSSQTTKEEIPKDQHSTGANAQRPATTVRRSATSAGILSAGRAGAVPYTTLDRSMFTSSPPVKPEVDEKNHADVLHASALVMAKKMYNQQQKMFDSSARMHARSLSYPRPDDTQDQERPAMASDTLQEAAYRLAQERLARLQEEHDKQRSLHEYYGSSGTPQRSRFGSIKGKLARRRSSSDGVLLDDRRRSEQIRKQMAVLDNKLTEVDEEKRARDREALLAAAQRNVKAQMQQIDEKVQSDTGRVPQVTMDDWGRKAHVAAQARLAALSRNNDGKVDIGGGKLVERSEVNKVAAQNVQPLLDEINERAEAEAARIQQEKLEEERRREKMETEKMREREIQEIHKKLKDQQRADEKARKAEIKRQEKAQRIEVNVAKAEQKRAASIKENKALPPFSPERTETGTDRHNQAPAEVGNKRSSGIGHVRTLSINFGKKRQPKQKTFTEKPIGADDNTTSPAQKVRHWLLSRFPKSRARSVSMEAADDGASTDSKRSFIGGVALARLRGTNFSDAAIGNKGKGKEIDAGTITSGSSLREIAMAGRPAESSRSQQPKPPPGIDGPGEGSGTATTTSTPNSTPNARAATPTIRSSPRWDNGSPLRRRQQQQQPPLRPSSQVSQVSIPASDVTSTRHTVSSLSNSSGDDSSSSNGGARFVDARSEPEEASAASMVGPSSSSSSSSSSPAAPVPRRLLVGSGITGSATGRASPFRESRFSEIL